MVPDGNTARGFERFIRTGFIVVVAANIIAVILFHFGVFKRPGSSASNPGMPIKIENAVASGDKP